MSRTTGKRPSVEPLSTEEASLLAEHEFAISQGLAAFVAVGLALLDIRERKLYRTEYKTFDEYCRKRWNFGARRGEQLMAAAEIAEKMRTGGSGFALGNERQARALAGVPPHLREEVLDRVKEQGEELTEQTVTRATIAILEEVRVQAREQADRAASAVLSDDEDDSEDEPEDPDQEEAPADYGADSEATPAATPTEATLRRAAKKVEKPRPFLARGLEHLRLAVKDLRKLDADDLATPDARQALRDGLSRADEVFSESRLLAKQAEEEA